MSNLRRIGRQALFARGFITRQELGGEDFGDLVPIPQFPRPPTVEYGYGVAPNTQVVTHPPTEIFRGRQFTLNEIDVLAIEASANREGHANTLEGWQGFNNSTNQPHQVIQAWQDVLGGYIDRIRNTDTVNTEATINLRVGHRVEDNNPGVISNRSANFSQGGRSALDEIEGWYQVVGSGLIIGSADNTLIEDFLRNHGGIPRDSIRVYLSIANPVVGNAEPQIFRANDNGTCWSDALIQAVEANLENVNHEKNRRRQERVIEELNVLKEKYVDGVPESQEVLQEFCDSARIKKIILLNALDEPIMTAVCQKNCWFKRAIAIQNSRANHVAYTADYDDAKRTKVYLEQEAFDAKKKELEATNEQQYWLKMSIKGKGVIGIRTPSTEYGLANSDFSTIQEWEAMYDLKQAYIDGETQPLLTKITKSAMRLNGCIDLQDYDRVNQKVYQIDQEKAYTQFHECPYYEGMIYKFSAMANMTSVKHEEAVSVIKECLGVYLITDVDTSNCSSEFRYYTSKLRYFGKSGSFSDDQYDNELWLYSPELVFLLDQGVTFKVRAGAWTHAPMDFRVTDEMKKKIDQVPLYSTWFGMTGAYSEYDSWVSPDRELEFAQLLQARTDNTIKYDRILREIQVQMPRHNRKHRMHLLGQTCMYARVNLMLQLLNIEPSTVLRVNVDAIYTTEELNDNQLILKFRKDEHCDRVSLKDPWDQLCNDQPVFYATKKLPDYEPELKEKYVLYTGAAGTGKSHHALRLHEHPGYFAKPWALSVEKAKSAKEDGIGMVATVIAMATKREEQARIKAFGSVYPSLLILDECTMATEGEVQAIKEYYPLARVIFIGDVEFVGGKQVAKQLCIEDDGINAPANFSWVETRKHFSTLWRFKDDEELQRIVTETRNLEVFVPPKEKIIKPDDLADLYNPETDLIICSRRSNKAGERHGVPKFNELLMEHNEQLEKPQYRYELRQASSPGRIRVVDEHTQLPKEFRGQIVITDKKAKCRGKDPKYRLAYATTMHSAQGQTIKDGRIFIDITRLWDTKMLYVAISRATSYDQLYFIGL